MSEFAGHLSTAVGYRIYINFFSHRYIHAMGKKSSLTKVRRAQIVTLHREGYAIWDIAAKLSCYKTVVDNAIVKFNADGTSHDMTRSGHPQKTTPREDCSMRQTVMRSSKSFCNKICAILCLKGTVISSSTVSRRV